MLLYQAMDSIGTFIADFFCLVFNFYQMEVYDVAFFTADTTNILVVTLDEIYPQDNSVRIEKFPSHLFSDTCSQSHVFFHLYIWS